MGGRVFSYQVWESGNWDMFGACAEFCDRALFCDHNLLEFEVKVCGGCGRKKRGTQ